MSMVLVSAVLSIVIIAVLLLHMVAGFVAALRRHGEEIEKEKEKEGGDGVVVGDGGEGMRRRRSGKKVRFGDVEERVIVDRCEGFAEQIGSEMEMEMVAKGFATVVEFVGGGEGVRSSAVVDEVESREIEEVPWCGGVSGLVEKTVDLNNCGGVHGIDEISEEGFEVEEIGEGGGNVIEDDIGAGCGDENVAYICLSEETSSVNCVGVEELIEEEGKEIQCMDVEDVDGGREEMEEEMIDEVADWIEKYMREYQGGEFKEENCVNEGCNNEFEEAEDPKDVADHLRNIEGGVVDESRVTEECKNVFEEATDPKDVADHLRNIEGGMVEESRVTEGCKNVFEEAADLEDVADILRNIEGGEVEENRVNEGCKEFEEAADPKVVADHLRNIVGGEENSFNDGCKNEFAESEELKDGVIEEQFEINEEDDWEGIEMSELYNDFTAAAAFVRKVETNGRLDDIGSEVKMQLYGFQKIVMEGPCNEAQPMALKMSARAKWNAWQRLGNMNPDDAMNQYISLVHALNPDWGEQTVEVDDPEQSEKPHFLLTSQRTCNDEGNDTGSSVPEFKD